MLNPVVHFGLDCGIFHVCMGIESIDVGEDLEVMNKVWNVGVLSHSECKHTWNVFFEIVSYFLVCDNDVNHVTFLYSPGSPYDDWRALADRSFLFDES